VTVDAVPFGDALDHDRRGRPLPVWQGCRRIANGEIFLMNPSVPDSLDGRYFGPLPARDVIGKATPLYTDEAGDGRFIWRAATR
jgi:type IV secretory pathway protease TraF